MQTWKEFKHDFDTVPFYTKKQYQEAIDRCLKINRVTRVIKICENCDVALNIHSIKPTDEGLIVYVK